MSLIPIDDSYTQGTFIWFRNLGRITGITNKYEVKTRGEGSIYLGTIKWFPRWRRYAFFPLGDTVYEETCMREIAQFIEIETQKHKDAKKRAKNV